MDVRGGERHSGAPVAIDQDKKCNRNVKIFIAAAMLIAAGALYQALATSRQRRRMVPPGSFIDVGGHRLHAWCAGSGTPAVLLESGIAASSVGWSLVHPAVAAFTRVCAYDRAGLAWSDRGSTARTFTGIVDELSRVLTAVAPGERLVLVGHSFGAFVVRAYASRHPERVVGLVLVDPPTEWLTRTPQQTRLLRGARRLSQIGALLARVGVVRACLALLTGGVPGAPRRFVKVFGPTAAHTLTRLVGEVRKLPPDVHPVVQELWSQPKCFLAMSEHLHVLDREASTIGVLDVSNDIAVVVISSGHQPAERLEEHRQLAQASRTGRHVVATRSTHWVQFDEPELIVAAIRELVDWRGATDLVRSAGSNPH